MNAFRKWMSNPTSRTLLGIFGFRRPGFLHRNDPYVAFFQYRIGPDQCDYYLYFESPPKKFGYRNEVFRKMREYNGHDLICFIEFHYKACEDKDGFISWIKYETLEQLNFLQPEGRSKVGFMTEKGRMEAMLLWAQEEGKKLQAIAQLPPPEMTQVPEIIQGSVAEGKQDPVDKIEEEISALLRTHQGRIDLLYNEHHMKKVIQVLSLLQDLREPGKKGLPLFKNFTDMDMAALLRQFVQFGDYKTNTLQVKISGIKSEMKLNDPALENLVKALQDFFFS
jgi:hypothetical protein